LVGQQGLNTASDGIMVVDDKNPNWLHQPSPGTSVRADTNA